jgi:hypothetical protein
MELDDSRGGVGASERLYNAIYGNQLSDEFLQQQHKYRELFSPLFIINMSPSPSLSLSFLLSLYED